MIDVSGQSIERLNAAGLRGRLKTLVSPPTNVLKPGVNADWRRPLQTQLDAVIPLRVVTCCDHRPGPSHGARNVIDHVSRDHAEIVNGYTLRSDSLDERRGQPRRRITTITADRDAINPGKAGERGTYTAGPILVELVGHGSPYVVRLEDFIRFHGEDCTTRINLRVGLYPQTPYNWLRMPHSPQPGVSILMPAYQLESVIADNIDRVVGVVDGWPAVEIIVINDGSTDDTSGYASKAAALHNVVSVIGYDVNRGKGGALKEGFGHATGDTIVFLDSDLDLPPEQLPAFITEFRHLGVDALVGAKRAAMAPGRYPMLRRGLSLAFATVNRVLFRLPIHETQTGLKVFKRSALESTLPRLETSGYTFDLELLLRIRKNGGSLAETPVALAPGSSSGLSISTLWEMGRDTVKIWVKSLSWK